MHASLATISHFFHNVSTSSIAVSTFEQFSKKVTPANGEGFAVLTTDRNVISRKQMSAFTEINELKGSESQQVLSQHVTEINTLWETGLGTRRVSSFGRLSSVSIGNSASSAEEENENPCLYGESELVVQPTTTRHTWLCSSEPSKSSEIAYHSVQDN